METGVVLFLVDLTTKSVSTSTLTVADVFTVGDVVKLYLHW
jgi:hypothetical protein